MIIRSPPCVGATSWRGQRIGSGPAGAMKDYKLAGGGLPLGRLAVFVEGRGTTDSYGPLAHVTLNGGRQA